MDFSEAKIHAMGVLFDPDVFTTLVIYTPNGAVSIPDIPANILYGISKNEDGRKGDGNTWRLTVEQDFRSNFGGGGTRSVATVVVKASDIPNPQYRDTITFDGNIWTVKEIYAD